MLTSLYEKPDPLAPHRPAPPAQRRAERRAALFYLGFTALVASPLCLSFRDGSDWGDRIPMIAALFGPIWLLILYGWQGTVRAIATVLGGGLLNPIPPGTLEDRMKAILAGWLMTQPDFAKRNVEILVRHGLGQRRLFLHGLVRWAPDPATDDLMEQPLPDVLIEALIREAVPDGNIYIMPMLSFFFTSEEIFQDLDSSHARMAAAQAWKDARDRLISQGQCDNTNNPEMTHV